MFSASDVYTEKETFENTHTTFSSNDHDGLSGSSHYPLTIPDKDLAKYVSKEDIRFTIEGHYALSIRQGQCTFQVHAKHNYSFSLNYDLVSFHYPQGVSYHSEALLPEQAFDYEISFPHDPNFSTYEQILTHERDLLDELKAPQDTEGALLLAYLDALKGSLDATITRADAEVATNPSGAWQYWREVLSQLWNPSGPDDSDASDTSEESEQSDDCCPSVSIDPEPFLNYYGLNVTAEGHMLDRCPKLKDNVQLESKQDFEEKRKRVLDRTKEMKLRSLF